MQISKLSPKNVLDTVRRRRFRARMQRVTAKPCPGLEHLGSEYGGWTVPVSVIDPSWLCYSVGAGHDVTFDLALLERGVKVRAFDPFHIFREMALRESGDDPKYSFHEVAIAPEDGPITMFGRQDEEMGTVSAVNLYGGAAHQRPGRTVPSLMAEFGDSEVQLLKLDVEGSEYDVVPPLDLKALGVQVLCVELHHSRPPKDALALLTRVESQGYELVHQEDGTDFTLVESSVLASIR